MNNTTEPGLVLLCTPEGVVSRVVSDHLDLAAQLPSGTPFTAILLPEAHAKAAEFLATVRAQGAAHNWSLTASVAGKPDVLHFGGALIDREMLVLAARVPLSLEQLHEELMRINNEQTNQLRATHQRLACQSAAPASARLDNDHALYEEFTRVNNELTNLQRAMARKNAELAKLNEQKNRFLGIAAHDLRSPLGIILTYAEFLETEATEALSAEHREFVTIIRETSDFMLHLVTDLLDVSTIESGRLELQREPVDLVALVERNVTLNRVLAGAKSITLRFDPSPDYRPTLPLDAGKIQQVLNNLITNAIKFSHPHTTVEITLTATPTGPAVTVRDEGQGIPEHDLSKLFKPFGKTSVLSTAGEQGTGLGLAIVQRIIEGHGGNITVTSEVGRGSSFRFFLPLDPT